MESSAELLTASCQARLTSADRLDTQALAKVQTWCPSWRVDEQGMERTYSFADFQATMAFVNAVADIAHAQDHHPDMQVSYNRCTVAFSTHSAGGLTWNDAICAARCDAVG